MTMVMQNSRRTNYPHPPHQREMMLVTNELTCYGRVAPSIAPAAPVTTVGGWHSHLLLVPPPSVALVRFPAVQLTQLLRVSTNGGVRSGDADWSVLLRHSFSTGCSELISPVASSVSRWFGRSSGQAQAAYISLSLAGFDCATSGQLECGLVRHNRFSPASLILFNLFVVQCGKGVEICAFRATTAGGWSKPAILFPLLLLLLDWLFVCLQLPVQRVAKRLLC
ncbi:hypothetical protein T10_13659 [Trichinella papuae]|uniref:Uncharacterized protein n=1 Tax=Trichinella papuae TaxID=268474 RepID=A0A0V1MMR0_9BILA|nr:hypothetical protein T10_13659 [Trichinella papuae]